MTNFHETYREHDVAKVSSARTFGLLMGAVFALLAFRSRVKGGAAWPWMAGVAMVFVFAAVARPALLNPLNRTWTAFGKLLNRIASPIVLAILFFGVVWPIGFLMRLAGSRPLRLTRAAASEGYWITREPLPNDHFTRQF